MPGISPFRDAQERFDTWVCLNGTAAQRANVGRNEGSRVVCGNPATYHAAAAGRGSTGSDLPANARETDFPYSVLGSVSRADYKRNQLSKVFDPNTRKIIILLIAGFLLAVALFNYE